MLRRRITALAIVASALAASSLFLLATPVLAAGPTFTVDSFLDQPDTLATLGTCRTAANTCTLRAAIMQANRSEDGATIALPPGFYSLTIPATGADPESNGDLNLTTPGGGDPAIAILGVGAATTVIDAGQLTRVLRVHSGRTATLSGVTLRNGYSIAGSGGGIYNEGALTVRNAAVRDSQAIQGGGIMNTGSLTLVRSAISGNGAPFSGGGIFTNGSVTVVDSTINQNATTGAGGGIENFGTLDIRGSTLHGNGAEDGGGIHNAEALVLVNSTLTRNNAGNHGGAIYNDGGIASAYSASIVYNGADTDVDFAGQAGGVFNDDALGAVFHLRNTLVAGNNVSNEPSYDDCAGTLTAYGRNLFYYVVAGCTIDAASGGSWDSLNALYTLSPALADNGGPTLTVAPLPDSNAIDGGDPVAGCIDDSGGILADDQRSAPRSVGVRCDVGALEVPEPGALAAVAVAIAMLAWLRKTSAFR